MKRRDLFKLPLACCFAPMVQAASPPWSARLMKGGFDGTAWNAAIAIKLTENWKTYWRVPGDGGIAPSFNISGDNIKASRVEYPAPKRFRDAAGMTIGYKHEVVFPLAIDPVDASRPIQLAFESFFGVCDVVCIPAQFSDKLDFDPAKADAPDQLIIMEWKRQVPVVKPQGTADPAREPVLRATVQMEAGSPVLKLQLAEAATDIFVEGEARHYFGEPKFETGGATLRISGATSAGEFQASRLRITVLLENAALEQLVTVG